MDELVKRLSEGEHPVEASLRPDRSAQALKDAIERAYVQIRFTNTQGGTELTVRIDEDSSDLARANFDEATGKVHLVGTLTLNYETVRCIADIDLNTLSGKGRLLPE